MMSTIFGALLASASAPDFSVSAYPRIAVIGVRSSWLTLATKSLRTFSRRCGAEHLELQPGFLFAFHGASVSELVTDAADRLDDVSGGAELLAQALHVGVDGARGDVGLDAPDVAEQRLARLHAAGPLEKRLEQ